MTFDLGGDVRGLQLARRDARNSLTPDLVRELLRQVDEAAAAGNRVVVLSAEGDDFCSGMDLGSAAQDPGATDGSLFWELLSRLRDAPLLTIAAIDGATSGGGVGLAAACDVVLATRRSTFALPEALWGLLPCCVLPFLRERVGSAVARRMMLTTAPLDAESALRVGLVDEVCAAPLRVARQISLRARRVAPETLAAATDFSRRLSADRAASREVALDTLAAVAASPLVRETLTRFSSAGTYPWESR